MLPETNNKESIIKLLIKLKFPNSSSPKEYSRIKFPKYVDTTNVIEKKNNGLTSLRYKRVKFFLGLFNLNSFLEKSSIKNRYNRLKKKSEKQRNNIGLEN